MDNKDIAPKTRRRTRTSSFGSLGGYPPYPAGTPPDTIAQIFCQPTSRRPQSIQTLKESMDEMTSRKDSTRTIIVEPVDNDSDKLEIPTQELTLQPKRLRCAVSFRADDTDKWGAQQMDAHEDYSLSLRDPTVKVDLLERLNTFRRNRELCDVVLFVREREIFAHKVVLAAVSPALFDMFIREDEEKANATNGVNGGSPPSSAASGDRTFNLPGPQPMAYFEFAQTDYDCFNALVNFAYTAYLEISSKKVAELYKTAYALQMTPVAKACANYLADNLSVHNCIGIRRQANFNKDLLLVDRVDKFITENFPAIAEESIEFTQLPVIKSRIIIPLEEVRNTKLGTCLAERALHYFEAYKCQRIEHTLEQVSSKTHLLYIDENRLADCADMDDRSSVGSCDVIQDYKKNGKKKENANVDLIGAPMVQHRVTGATAVRMDASRVPNDKYGSTESLDSVNSDRSDTQNTIGTRLLAVHQTSGEYWVALVVLYHRLVVLSIQLTDDEDLTNNKKEGNGAIDAQKQQLLNRLVSATGAQRTPLPTMSGARCSIGAAFLNGKIVVCGGYDRGECLKSVEEYDVVKGAWRQLPPMLDERGRFDSAVLNGKVYAIAGSNGHNDLKTAELYDPKTEKWTQIKSLIKARSHNGCATVDGKIYCVGGSNDQVVMKDCEKYEPSTDEWSMIPPMATARYQAGVIAWRGLVVAVGGCDRWSCLDKVEAYDPKTNSWKELAQLRTPRRGCAVAVVKDNLYAIGGHDGTNSLATVEVLEHPSANWRPGPVLTSPRANTHSVVTAGNVIYTIGGFNGNQFLNSIELLESENIGWCNWQQNSVQFSLLEEDENDVEEHSSELSTSPPSILGQTAVEAK